LLAALALAVTLLAVPANAQTAIRTFVSTTGSDTNPCSITAPCRHFSAAVTATSAGGEVDALEAGAYGSFTINQAITIEGQGWSYVAPPNGEAAITINASSGTVSIRGVSLNGVGATGFTTGISFTGAGTLNIENSVIRNFTNGGISLGPSAASQVFVSDTLLADDVIGFSVFASSSVTGTIDHVRAENNFGKSFLINAPGTFSISNSVAANSLGTRACAINVQGSSNSAVATLNISDSTIDNNTNGICAESFGTIIVRNSTVTGSTTDGILAFGGTVWVTRSTINANNTGVAIDVGGTVNSYGDNNLFGNGPTGTNNGSFTSTLQYK
jgi:hypothetical protein